MTLKLNFTPDQTGTDTQKENEKLHGFRLHRLEVLNWGTFDGQVWSIEPAGHTALLTGVNGSGKSTLVDALLTLLVPSRGRNYNQASGASGKRERSEQSYVLGAYGKVQEEGDYQAKEQFLREKNSLSILLAQFGNGREWATAVQIFWFQESLKKFYLLANRPLSIQEHLAPNSNIRAYKKRLRELDGVQLFDQFNKYSKAFRKRVSLRSNKALDLFNQTVTIKEIGSLNEFVRQHMLEAPPTREKVQGLIENFDNLTQAHEALEKARQQLNLLRPLVNLADRYDALEEKLAHWQACEAAVPAYFAGRKAQLLERDIAAAEQDKARVENRLTAVVEQLKTLREREKNLEVSIAQDSTGQRLREIETSLRYKKRERYERQKQAQQYDRLAKEFDLPQEVNEATFYASKKKAEGFYPAIEKHLAKMQDELRQHQISQNEMATRERELQSELASLRQRPSQIPAQNLRLRTQILDALGIAERDVPFVGELVRVREQEKKWEGAIERLLHSFGLRLLVPERHYARLAEYVRRTHLGGRLVFHRVPEDLESKPLPTLEPHALYHKLRLKPETMYRPWLEQELTRQYNYLCCEELAEFQRAGRAITPEGLIKSGGERHEKDDRRQINDQRYFILGWSNEAKIRALAEELDEVTAVLKRLQNDIAQAHNHVKNAFQKQERLDQFLAFTDFTPLDAASISQEISQLETEQTQLEASSNKLQQLRHTLEQVQTEMSGQEETRTKLQSNLGGLNAQIRLFQQELARCETELAGLTNIEQMKQYAAEIRQLHPSGLTRAGIDDARRQVEAHFRDTIRQEQTSLQGLSNNLIGQMRNYKAQFPAETVDFDNSLEAIPAFRETMARIEHDDLPQYESRFKALLNEKIVHNVTILQGDLGKYEEEIRESVAVLNESLRTIDYTADTYIQLQTKPNIDPEIRTFRHDLRACIPNIGEPDEQKFETSYQRVKVLIDRFKEDARWTNKVTDVRHWLDFSASERYRADDSERHYYSDSSGKSGGQKAKLAYTILASAIAYQYGLDTAVSQPDTFRFVVVDEAFSRSDEINSRYAMQLFQTLGLQLLVVTPMTGTHIVEPYVAACHFVFNNSEGNRSQIINMPIAAYQQNLRAHQQQGA